MTDATQTDLATLLRIHPGTARTIERMVRDVVIHTVSTHKAFNALETAIEYTSISTERERNYAFLLLGRAVGMMEAEAQDQE